MMSQCVKLTYAPYDLPDRRVMDPPSITSSQDSLSDILPIVLGGCLLAAVFLATVTIAIVTVCLMCKRWHRSHKTATTTPLREEAIYDEVLFPKPEENIDLTENDAYGVLHTGSPRYETIGPQLRPNAAYAQVQHSDPKQVPVYPFPEQQNMYVAHTVDL